SMVWWDGRGVEEKEEEEINRIRKKGEIGDLGEQEEEGMRKKKRSRGIGDEYKREDKEFVEKIFSSRRQNTSFLPVS
ncbi:hypothetical protein VSW53_01110, partial [Borreliella burgdorferi]|uniref:hypothetical protein n=1 Tax=Borreliella burgdorferi TaxID=139 RepID=UPI003DA467DB